MLKYRDLVNGFRKIGLSTSDIVMVHSSFNSFGGVVGGPRTVIKAILDVIGNTGTLIMPTFTFRFCEQFNKFGVGFFDVESTPSEMGVLTEIVRKMPGAKRSYNPIYSVSVVGRYCNLFSGVDDKNVFGGNSVFSELHRLDGKIMTIGLPPNRSWTFVHYIEENQNVDYRFHKTFRGFIVDNNGFNFDGFVFRVRNRGIVTNIEPMIRLCERDGVIDSVKIGSSLVQIVSCKSFYDYVVRMMKQDPNLLYGYDYALKDIDIRLLEDYMKAEFYG